MVETTNEAANFVIDEADVKLFHDDGIPGILFSDRTQRLKVESLKNSVVVKLLGKSIGYRALWTRIHAPWNPVGEIKIVDLDNDYFIVKLNSHKDYLNAFTGGPWVILGHYLIVQLWNPMRRRQLLVLRWHGFGFRACRSNTTTNLFYELFLE